MSRAIRIVQGEPQKICQGLWTRHSKDYVSSSVIDYVLVSEEHLVSIIEMTIDQDGRLGGGSDHNMLISRWEDKFISIPKVEPVRKPGWDIQNANWVKFRSIVEDEIVDQTLETRDIELLSNSLSRILTKGLNSAAGKKPNIPPKQKLYPRHIVTLLKERKILERVFKTAKSKFVGSIGDQVASNSLVIAKDNLDSMTAELNEAKSRFEGQQRGPLMNITKSKSKKDRRRFWDYVKRKTKKSLSFPPLQKKTTGVLVHSPQDISDEVFNYLKDIFSGSDIPPSTSSLAASISSDSTRHDNLLSHDHAQGKQDALPPQFEAPRPPPFPQAHLGDHAYCSNPNPVLNKGSPHFKKVQFF